MSMGSRKHVYRDSWDSTAKWNRGKLSRIFVNRPRCRFKHGKCSIWKKRCCPRCELWPPSDPWKKAASSAARSRTGNPATLLARRLLQLGPHTGTNFISPKSPHFYNACITVKEFCDSCPILHDVCFVLEIQNKKVKKNWSWNWNWSNFSSQRKKERKRVKERKDRNVA